MSEHAELNFADEWLKLRNKVEALRAEAKERAVTVQWLEISRPIGTFIARVGEYKVGSIYLADNGYEAFDRNNVTLGKYGSKPEAVAAVESAALAALGVKETGRS